MNTRLLFLHALSPLHAGTGQGVGVIDLPIAREKATNRPYVPGSSIKGVLGDLCGQQDKSRDPKLRYRVFGPPPNEAGENAGAAQISDSRLLLLPVRSLNGTFAWTTSADVLRRFRRDDAAIAGFTALPDVPQTETENGCFVASNSAKILYGADAVYLEDLDLKAQPNDAVAKWAEWIGERVFPGDGEWQNSLAARLCVVHDDVFDFLLTTATEVIARVRLNENKTVERGGLWYEEALPAETILAGIVTAEPVEAANLLRTQVFNAVSETFQNHPVQLGGKATVGRGLCRLQMPAMPAPNNGTQSGTTQTVPAGGGDENA